MESLRLAIQHPLAFWHLKNLSLAFLFLAIIGQFHPNLANNQGYSLKNKCWFKYNQQICKNAAPIDFIPQNNKPNFQCVGCALKFLTKQNFDSFHHLQTLTIIESQIEAIDILTFSHLKQLEILQLIDDNLQFINVGIFDSLKELLILNLGWNKLQELPSDIFDKLIKLQTLNIEHNQLIYLENYLFNNLENLIHLYLNYNNLTELEPKSFNGLINLEYLNLSHNNLHKLSDNIFQALLNLKHLNLSNNKLNKIQSDIFAHLRNLIMLDLQHNNIIEIEFKYLPKCTNINLQNNQIINIKSDTFNGVPNLQKLNLSNNKINNINISALQSTKSLELLNISNNNLTYLPIGLFSNLFELVSLDISNLGDEIITSNLIFSMNNVQNLTLNTKYFNKLDYKIIIKELRYLENLIIVNEKWSCNKIMEMYKLFKQQKIRVLSKLSVTNMENIHGIPCIHSNETTTGATEIKTTPENLCENYTNPKSEVINAVLKELIQIQAFNKRNFYIQLFILCILLIISYLCYLLFLYNKKLNAYTKTDYLKLQ